MNKIIKVVPINKNKFLAGFSFAELLIVIAIILILGTIALSAIRSSRQSSNVSAAGYIQGQFAIAAALYASRMGFYPPDVNRGWDPGLVRPLPWNADAEAGSPPPGTSGENCDHCPANWQSIVQSKWDGPYIPQWPRFTPWGGKYDYNYWGSSAVRYGCNISAGVYLGVQGDYDNNNTIPVSAEQEMMKRGFDADNCVNGESQLALRVF
ncbi:MAG: hypothetical protein Q7S66_05865 [bacterium]|nr:hypothetical protein [bacterium]